jgi:hypothetical protein
MITCEVDQLHSAVPVLNLFVNEFDMRLHPVHPVVMNTAEAGRHQTHLKENSTTSKRWGIQQPWSELTTRWHASLCEHRCFHFFKSLHAFLADRVDKVVCPQASVYADRHHVRCTCSLAYKIKITPSRDIPDIDDYSVYC